MGKKLGIEYNPTALATVANQARSIKPLDPLPLLPEDNACFLQDQTITHQNKHRETQRI